MTDLRPIEVEDLLGRDPVTPNLELLTANVSGKVVMITGAGGSIGAELSRQLLKLAPKMLVLFELSEVTLYEISTEIEQLRRRLEKEAGGGASAPPSFPPFAEGKTASLAVTLSSSVRAERPSSTTISPAARSVGRR